MVEAVWGIDVGGTKIAAALVDATGRILAREQIATDAEGTIGMPKVVAMARELAARAGSDVRALACAVGTPGPIDFVAGAIVGAPNVRGWWSFPIAATLRRELGVPVKLVNDANAAALGEQRFGAGRGVRNMVYLTISTGIGSGAVIDGKLLTGEDGNAPELGHCTIDYRGRVCGCGLPGCLEAYASGTAIAARARELGKPWSTAAEVVDAVRTGDTRAKEIWDEAMAALAAGVGNAIDTFNPKRVVLGGGLTNAGALLFDAVRARVSRHAMPAILRGVEIVPAELGADVGVLGAAAVAWDLAAPPTT